MALRRKLMDFARLAMVDIELSIDEMDMHNRCMPMGNIHPLSVSHGEKITIPAPPSTQERDAVRSRLFQSIESEAIACKNGDIASSASLRKRAPADLSKAQYAEPVQTTGSLARSSKNERWGRSTAESSTKSLRCFSQPPPMPVMSLDALVSGKTKDNIVSSPTTTKASLINIRRKKPYQADDNSNGDEHPRLKCSTGRNYLGNMPFSSLSAKIHAEASFAASLIARSLGLDLVYLLRVCPIRPDLLESELAGHGLQTQVLVSYGMPHPEPNFDGSLHLRALRSDGGLLYSNQNKVPKDEGCGYQVGILLPLLRDRNTNANSSYLRGISDDTTAGALSRGGIVLCAFTRSTRGSSSFSGEEVRVLRDFGGAMREILCQTAPKK